MTGAGWCRGPTKGLLWRETEQAAIGRRRQQLGASWELSCAAMKVCSAEVRTGVIVRPAFSER